MIIHSKAQNTGQSRVDTFTWFFLILAAYCIVHVQKFFFVVRNTSLNEFVIRSSFIRKCLAISANCWSEVSTFQLPCIIINWINHNQITKKQFLISASSEYFTFDTKNIENKWIPFYWSKNTMTGIFKLEKYITIS